MKKVTEVSYQISFKELKEKLGIKNEIIAAGHKKIVDNNIGLSFEETYGIEVVVR